MERLKHSGFYRLKFFITPEEFKSVLKLFEQKQAQFQLTNYARTKHNQNEVYESYRRFYQFFTGKEKTEGYHPFLYIPFLLPLRMKALDSL